MFEFTDDCLIGVNQIDEEHKGLFRLIGEMYELAESEWINDKYDRLCAMLARLKNYADEHFRHEEEYMEQIGHPELELQKKQHLEFDRKITEADAIIDGQNPDELLRDLLIYLVRWLYRHIIGSDLMIGKMISVEEWKKKSYAFTEKYLTGIELIDEEHRELFRIINNVHDVLANEFLADKYDEIVRLLEELRTVCDIEAEPNTLTRLMNAHITELANAGIEAQKTAHDIFTTRLDKMDLSEIDENQQETLEELMVFLTEWLINHILQMDKRIGAQAQ